MSDPLALSILYRGPLSSCSYGCEYCPFAKKTESAEELAVDRAAWERFLGWVEARDPEDQLGVFVTPWGEALIRRWYQDGLARLTALPQIVRAAIQTNLSGPLDWIARCPAPQKLGLWCTYHPKWTTRAKFVAQCRRLEGFGVRHSVGVVGFPDHLEEARALRRELPASTYLWINAVKTNGPGYDEASIREWEAIDPLFRVNLPHYRSLGRSCRAGESAIAVDGDGTMRRCHFIKDPIGNLHQPGWREALAPRDCSNATCKCHIGYVHLDYLELGKVFGSGILERVPEVRAR